MWRLLAVSLLAELAVCRPTTTPSSPCTNTDLLSSLSRDGLEFCESLMDSHCATASTPAPYTTYDSDEVSSYCECILTDKSLTETEATSGSGFGQATETTDAYSPPEPSATSSLQESSDSGSMSGSEYSTATSTGYETTGTANQTSGAGSGSFSSTNRTATSPTTGSGSTTSTDPSSGEPTDSAEGGAITRPASPTSDGTATTASTSAPGSGSWNSTASASATASGPTDTAGTVSSGTTMPTESGTEGTWNSTATSGQTTSSSPAAGGSQTTSPTPGQPSGTVSLPTISEGSWNSTAASSPTLNGTSMTAGPTSPPSLTLPSGSTGLPPLPTSGGGSWNSTAGAGESANATVIPPGSTGPGAFNSTATSGTSSLAVSLITGSPGPGPGPAPTSVRTSTGSGLSVLWNTSLSSGVGQGTTTLLPTGTLPTTLSHSNTSGAAFTRPTDTTSSSISRISGANATSSSAGAVSSLPPSILSSTFPGWNATLSTSAGQVTGTAATSTPTGTGASQTTLAPTSGSIHVSGSAAGNSTIVSVSSTEASAGQQNSTMATGTVSPSGSLPVSSGQSNVTTTRGSSSGAVNSTAVSATALQTTSSDFTTSASGNITSSLSTNATPTVNATAVSSSSTVSTVSTVSTAASGFTNSTTEATTTRIFPSTTGTGNVSSTALPTDGSDPVPSGTEIPVANFTEVFRNAALAQETCYSLPQDDEGDATRRAVVRNSKLRENNISIPAPYIESIDFDSEGLQPLFMTVRDAEQGTFFLDVSNKSRLAIVDESGASMVLDDRGVRLATNSCRYDVNVTISDMFAQLADLSGTECSFGNSSVPPPPPVKRAEDMQFNQTLFLQDQCGNAVTRSIRDYPELRIGDTECVDVTVDEDLGRWDFDCTYPGSDSGTIRCQNTIKNDIMDFLVRDAYGGECPDVSTMVSTLANSSSDVLNRESFREELLSKAAEDDEAGSIDAVVDAYEGLWLALQGFFIPSEGNPSTPWETFFSVYNENRSFENDICESLHAGEIPLSLNLRAGATYIDAITTLNWAPETAEPYNITVQDPSSRACCPSSFVAEDQGQESCRYPSDAFVVETGCICGETTSGEGIAYEATECSNFEDTCESDADCSSEEFVCLTGTCCGGGNGGGVCVDQYACSQNGTALVTFDLDGAWR